MLIWKGQTSEQGAHLFGEMQRRGQGPYGESYAFTDRVMFNAHKLLFKNLCSKLNIFGAKYE